MQKVLHLFKRLILWFFVSTTFMVIVFRFVPIPFTPLMAMRFFENKSGGNENYFSHDWESIENISPNLQKAVIASEDASFCTHYGFDFVAIKKAFKNNEKGRKLRGGSTISQQTAKNVFLWQGRSWIRKGLETYFTILIEMFWSKQRIMEVYLNSIEMGNGIYGAQAAARHWYSTDASELSRRQAAGIAAILPNPRKFDASHSSGFIEGRKGRIMKHMNYIKLKY